MKKTLLFVPDQNVGRNVVLSDLQGDLRAFQLVVSEENLHSIRPGERFEKQAYALERHYPCWDRNDRRVRSLAMEIQAQAAGFVVSPLRHHPDTRRAFVVAIAPPMLAAALAAEFAPGLRLHDLQGMHPSQHGEAMRRAGIGSVLLTHADGTTTCREARMAGVQVILV